MRTVFLTMACVCFLCAAADAPYAGKWKMNAAKSDFGSSTVLYEQLSGGEMKATMDGVSYTFKFDGKDYMTPWGMTTAWKAVDARTWEMTEKIDGKVIANSTAKLSPDGNTLTVDSKRAKADGGSADSSITLQRVSGGPGMAGRWRTRKLSTSTPDTLSLIPKGSDGLTISIANEGGVCDARFDGKDYPARGPLWSSGWTCAVTKRGAGGLNLTWKMNGKDMYKSVLSVSGDGKILTETMVAAGMNEKTIVVFDRQ